MIRLILLLAGIVAAEDGTPYVMAYMANNYALAKVEYDSRRNKIQGDAAARGLGCSSGIINQFNSALVDISQTFYNLNLDYTTRIANSRLSLSNKDIASTFTLYADSLISLMILEQCGRVVARDTTTVNQINSIKNIAVLNLATIIPLPPLVRVDTVKVTVRDTVKLPCPAAAGRLAASKPSVGSIVVSPSGQFLGTCRE